jgi:hypothetical protein
MVSAAVDRYLATRGISSAGPSAAAAPPSNIAAEVVDRFLSRRSGTEKSGFS